MVGESKNHAENGFNQSAVLTPQEFGWKLYQGKDGKFDVDSAYEAFRITSLDAREITEIIDSAGRLKKRDLVKSGYVNSVYKEVQEWVHGLRNYGWGYTVGIIGRLKHRHKDIPLSINCKKRYLINYPIACEGFNLLKLRVRQSLQEQGFDLFHADYFPEGGFRTFYQRPENRGILIAEGSVYDRVISKIIEPYVELKATKDIQLEEVAGRIREHISREGLAEKLTEGGSE